MRLLLVCSTFLVPQIKKKNEIKSGKKCKVLGWYAWMKIISFCGCSYVTSLTYENEMVEQAERRSNLSKFVFYIFKCCNIIFLLSELICLIGSLAH